MKFRLLALACTLLIAACGDDIGNGKTDGRSDGATETAKDANNGGEANPFIDGGDGSAAGDGTASDGASASDGSSTDGNAPTDGASSSDGGGTTSDGGSTTADGGSTTADGGSTTADGGSTTADGGNTTSDGGGTTTDGGSSTTDGGATADAPGDASSNSDGGASTRDGAAADAPGDASAGSDGPADAAPTVDFARDGGASVTEGGATVGNTQCTDGIDNDGDGLVDALDPQCTGPLDNDEASYATGIPGDNKDPCKQDCFFDGNSGAGDDRCEWNLRCDPANPGQYLAKQCLYDPSWANNPNKCPQQQKQICLDKCRKITPNGCDCFGCCAFPLTAGGSVTVLLSATCKTQADLSDPTKCVPCTQTASCLNPCDRCEVCIGKPAPDPSCFGSGDSGAGSDSGANDTGASGDSAASGDGGTNPFCPNGWTYCGPGGVPPSSCPSGTYCITGCCVPSDTVP